MRERALTAAVLLMTAACGGDGGRQSLPAGGPQPSAAGARPSAQAGAVVAGTDLGPLPAPATGAELQRRAVGMPETLRGAGRAQGPPEQVRYAGDNGDFGIEVAEAEDLYPDVATTAAAFPRLREQLIDPQSCGRPPSYCVRGGSQGQEAVIWGHDDSPLVFVALAPDEATLTDLLGAWRAG